MATPRQRLEDFYNRFGDRRFDELGGFLSGEAWYMQLNSMRPSTSPRGRAAVVAALSNWDRWFRDMSVLPLSFTALGADMVKKVSGATHCFEVKYSFAGRYVQAIPDLHSRPLKLGREVNLFVTDTVWINRVQQITCISSSFQVY
jgi:hypothetical protein